MECGARKKDQPFKASGADIDEVGTKEGSEESGKDSVNTSRMALGLTEKVLFQMLSKCFGISRLSVSKVEVLEGSMECKHLVITCSLTVNNQEIATHILIDCDATGIAFMDQDFARHHEIPLQELNVKRQLEVIDGRPIESGDIMHIAKVGIEIHEHKEQLPMFITKSGHYPMVLEIPWLQLHDVAVRFVSTTVTFGSQYCVTYCQDMPVTVQGVTEEPPEHAYKEQVIIE